MMKPSIRRFAAIAVASGLAVHLLAQSASELSSQGKAAYDQKLFAKSADLYIRAYKLGKSRGDLYNAACSFALDGQKAKAFEALEEAAKHGYNNIGHLQTDTDLTSLRGEPAWAKIVAKVEENAKKNPPPKPWKRPYSAVDLKDAAFYETKLGGENSAVYQDGEVLTFVVRSKATAVALTGGIQEPMKRVEGSEIWALPLTMPGGWDGAFASYGFIETPRGPMVPFKNWSGPKAPALPEAAETLQGKIHKVKLRSKSWGEERELVIYIPPNPTKGLPAVFMADGGSCEPFAKVLEPLILAGKVRPCAIVGIPSGKYMGKPDEPFDPMKDNRARDYLPGLDPHWFDQHMNFFTNEVGSFVAKEFGISTKREDRAVTGFSNGGAFSAAVAYRMPQFFGVAMPLSLGVPPEDGKPKSPLPKMFFAAGRLEVFGLRTSTVYEQVKSWGAECSYDEYMAGHDFEMWKLAFSRLMPKAFPPRR